MAFVYDKTGLIDLFMRVWQGAYPDRPVARKKIEGYVREIRDDGEIIKSDAGEQNLTGIEILAAVALGVVSSLVYDMMKVGARQLFAEKSDEQILQDVYPTRNQERREVTLVVIHHVREHEVDTIEADLRDKGRNQPG